MLFVKRGNRVEAEAAALTAGRHPGVVELVDVCDGALRTRMVEGARSLAETGPLTPDEVAGLLASLATTVADLHDRGIVHGGLEAGHVLVRGDGRPVLCSLGRGGDEAGDVAALGHLAAALLATPPGRATAPTELVRDRWDANRRGRWRRRAPGPEPGPDGGPGDGSSGPPAPRTRRAGPWWRAGPNRRRRLGLGGPPRLGPMLAPAAAPALAALVAEATAADPGARPTAKVLAAAVHQRVPTARLPVPLKPSLLPPPAGAGPRRRWRAGPSRDLPAPPGRRVDVPDGAGAAGPPAPDGPRGPRRPVLDDAGSGGASVPDGPRGLRRPVLAGARATHPLAPDGPRRPRRVSIVVVLLAAGGLLVATVVVVTRSGTGPAGIPAPGSPTGRVATASGPGARPLPAPDRTDRPGHAGRPEPGAATTTAPVATRVWPPEPLDLSDGVLRIGATRYALGRPGDAVVSGDWACTGQRTLVLLRPATGELFAFDGWASEGMDAVGRPLATVDGAVGLRTVHADGDGCDEVEVARPGGPPVRLQVAP